VTDKVKVSAFLFYSSTLNLIRRRTFQPQGIDIITLATTVLLHLLWLSNLATFGYLRKLHLEQTIYYSNICFSY
jgi:hypothetical protein